MLPHRDSFCFLSVLCKNEGESGWPVILKGFVIRVLYVSLHYRVQLAANNESVP